MHPVRGFRGRNRGVSYARNVAMKAARRPKRSAAQPKQAMPSPPPIICRM